MNPYLVRKKSGLKSRFETDPELAEYLETIDRYYTLEELRLVLVVRFGADRVPSKSSIHRYLQKLTRGKQ